MHEVRILGFRESVRRWFRSRCGCGARKPYLTAYCHACWDRHPWNDAA